MNRCKFILVHSVQEAKPIVINSLNVVLIEKSSLFQGATKIIFDSYIEEIETDTIHVTETPEKIFEMLE